MVFPSPPAVSVVIPTRNRGDDVVHTVRAILDHDTDVEVIVVDQSTDDRTWQALQGVDDPRLTVVRSDRKGISNARNDGVAVARADVIAFTDDDCRPVPGWAGTMRVALDDRAAPAIVFGKVSIPETTAGEYAPAFDPERLLIEGVAPYPGEGIGIGASFAVTRAAFDRLGGFDPLLGAGAPVFTGGEETDFALRALGQGMRVAASFDAEVLHLGVRRGEEVTRLIIAYRRAVGAAYGKYARLHPLGGVRACAPWIVGQLVTMARAVVARRSPNPGVLAYFVLGFVASFRYGLDRRAQRLRQRRR